MASTGVIGVPLPMDRVAAGIRAAAGRVSPEGGGDAAQAIMTTDTFPKRSRCGLRSAARRSPSAAMAKGSGMIHPNMATMLGFVTTDAAIDAAALQGPLRERRTPFNMITVDGDTSTNDMVVVLANGLAGNPDHPGHRPLPAFAEALPHVLIDLAKAIARDGEGATKLIEVRVKGRREPRGRPQGGPAVIGSNLVKAAVFGADANWGRVIAALGHSGAQFDPDRVDIWLGDVSD